MLPESEVTSTRTRPLASDLFFKRFARRNADFAKLDESFLARKHCVLESKSCLRSSNCTEANLFFELGALQPDPAVARENLTASQSSVATASSKLDKLHANSRHLTSYVSDTTSTANILRPQPSESTSFSSLAALDSLCGERGRYFVFLQPLVGHIDSLDSDCITLLTRARDSSPSFHQEAGSPLENFCASVEEDDIPKDGSVPLYT